MTGCRATVTVTYEPGGGERFAVTSAAEGGDEYTLDALQVTASRALREAVSDAFQLFAKKDEDEKT